jgi:hypothetical protein
MKYLKIIAVMPAKSIEEINLHPPVRRQDSEHVHCGYSPIGASG